MLFAVASLGKKHANPYGPELQVKQMLYRRLRRVRGNDRLREEKRIIESPSAMLFEYVISPVVEENSNIYTACL